MPAGFDVQGQDAKDRRAFVSKQMMPAGFDVQGQVAKDRSAFALKQMTPAGFDVQGVDAKDRVPVGPTGPPAKPVPPH